MKYMNTTYSSSTGSDTICYRIERSYSKFCLNNNSSLGILFNGHLRGHRFLTPSIKRPATVDLRFIHPYLPNVPPPTDRTMIRLFKVKEKQKQEAENAIARGPLKKQSAGELRLHKDISELNLPKSCTISFPNGKDDLMTFEISIKPDEGYYMGGKFLFTFSVSGIYPHVAPKVKCKTKVYHPNIDSEGNVCLNILREYWKPVLNINTIVYGLYHLFTEPNHEDPLNHEAAGVLRDNPKAFRSNVKMAMAGGRVGDTSFARCI